MARQIVTWGDWVRGRSILTSKIESEIELLERHVTMLKAIMEHEPIGIIRLSEQLNVPQHKVRYSLRILEQEGLIAPSPEGAITTEKLPLFFNDLRTILTSMDETVNKLRTSLPMDTGRPGQKA
jgi:predicted transcriptional regulator